MRLPYWGFRDSFSTARQMREVLSRMLDGVLSYASIEEEPWYDLKIILHELCCNALEHGKGPVELFSAVCKSDNSLHILVSDQGAGFDPRKNKPQYDENAESGRGLQIVTCLADDIMFSNSANRVLVRMQL